jgi:hypothetical protein
MPQLAATLLPITHYVMETEPLGSELRSVIRHRGAVSDTDRLDNHYRIIGDNRLQWAGGMTVWQADPAQFARTLAASIRRTFPQLAEVKVANVWSGTFGRTLHNMPQIGEIERGLWVASGFGRHGLNTTAIAGELVARGIVENDQTWRLFAPYELVWAGGKAFRAVAQARYAISRPIGAFWEALARYRERSRIRRDIKAATRRSVRAAKEKARKAVPAPARPPEPASPGKAAVTAELLPTPALLDDNSANEKPARGRRTPR